MEKCCVGTKIQMVKPIVLYLGMNLKPRYRTIGFMGKGLGFIPLPMNCQSR
jgi:hypothetical protein